MLLTLTSDEKTTFVTFDKPKVAVSPDPGTVLGVQLRKISQLLLAGFRFQVALAAWVLPAAKKKQSARTYAAVRKKRLWKSDALVAWRGSAWRQECRPSVFEFANCLELKKKRRETLQRSAS